MSYLPYCLPNSWWICGGSATWVWRTSSGSGSVIAIWSLRFSPCCFFSSFFSISGSAQGTWGPPSHPRKPNKPPLATGSWSGNSAPVPCGSMRLSAWPWPSWWPGRCISSGKGPCSMCSAGRPVLRIPISVTTSVFTCSLSLCTIIYCGNCSSPWPCLPAACSSSTGWSVRC